MSCKSSSDTPPPGGADLLSELQVPCQSPALTAALRSSPLAAQLTQQVTPAPASATPTHDSDYHTSVQCLSDHLPKPLQDTLLVLPGTQPTWECQSTSSRLHGYSSPVHFTTWVTAPPVVAPPTSSQLAAQLLITFSGQYPWSVLVKGTVLSDPACGSTLPLVGATSLPSPLPSLSENTVDSVVLLAFTLTCTRHRKVSA